MALPKQGFIVFCGTDKDAGSLYREHILATRRVFATKADAAAYAEGINASRHPVVVPVSSIYRLIEGAY